MKVSKTTVHNAILPQRRPPYAQGGYSSPMSSSKKIQAKLIDTGTAISTKTIQRRLSLLKSCQRPRLTEAMKEKRLDFAKRHADWNTEMWKRVLFSDESSVSQFSVRKYRVWRPAGARRGKVHSPNSETSS